MSKRSKKEAEYAKFTKQKQGGGGQPGRGKPLSIGGRAPFPKPAIAPVPDQVPPVLPPVQDQPAGPGPWTRGPGQGITGAGYQYHFPATAQTTQTTQRHQPGLEPEPPAAAPTAPPAPPSHAVAPMPSGGLTIGYELRPPHSLRTADGKPCRTDRWFDRAGLVYDASQPDDGPMGFDNPRLFLAGTAFRCYYPHSTRSDFAAIMSSGSGGRWLNAWGEKSNYVRF